MSRPDHKHSALLVGTGSVGGATPDLELEWLQLQPGVVGGSVNDAWNNYWDTLTLPAILPGTHNDRAFEWLGTLGHDQGTLVERWDSYWRAASILAAGGSFIHPHLAVATVALMAWYDRALFWMVDGVRGLFA